MHHDEKEKGQKLHEFTA